MNILVLNGGSSSIKFSVFAATNAVRDPSLLLDGELSGLTTDDIALTVGLGNRPPETVPMKVNVASAAATGIVLDAVNNAGVGTIDSVGYRVVHPGAEIHEHVRITNEVLGKLEAAASFAPLHDPEAVKIIRETMRRLPDVPHVVCFDTVFHQTMPEEASVYAIPKRYREQGVKRYGFHGLSCESIVRQMQKVETLPPHMVIAHLGSGCSVTALVNGISVDTTMGLTPAGGVMMGTRPGDLDPGLMLYLLRQQKGEGATNDVETMLNHCAGMVALSGLRNDVKAVRQAAAEGSAAAVLTLKVFTRGVRKAIGGFAWLMGGLDTLVFTGGIGEHDSATRAEVLDGTGALIDSLLNEVKADGVRRISASDSKTSVFAAPAQEDLVIALHVRRMVQAEA